MSLLSLLLLFGLGPPQGYQVQPLTPDELMNGLMLYPAQQARKLDRIQIDQMQSSNTFCFAIRSYIFEREDGNAPVLVGTTTCTPSSVFRSKRVGDGKARLIPLN